MKIEKILHLKEEISAKEKIYGARAKQADTPKSSAPVELVIPHDNR